MNEKEAIKISKFLSLVLRHQPDSIGIVLDENGWTDISILLQQSGKAGMGFTLEQLQHVVYTNPKQRFAIHESGTKIRANQGHSVTVDLGYAPQIPPDVLYHGTAESSLAGIAATGLEKRKRHHVHLSPDTETAVKVGSRHGKAVVLTIRAREMWEAGFVFYRSENGVWLVEGVPVGYIEGLPAGVGVLANNTGGVSDYEVNIP